MTSGECCDFVRLCEGVGGSGDGEGAAGVRGFIECPGMAPGGWLSVMGGVFRRLGHSKG